MIDKSISCNCLVILKLNKKEIQLEFLSTKLSDLLDFNNEVLIHQEKRHTSFKDESEIWHDRVFVNLNLIRQKVDENLKLAQIPCFDNSIDLDEEDVIHGWMSEFGINYDDAAHFQEMMDRDD